MMRVHVAGGDDLNLQRLGEVAQQGAAAHVATLVRALQLDEETVAAERLREPRRPVRVAQSEPVARAAGEANEAVVQVLQQRLLELRWQRLVFAARQPRVPVRLGEEPAEVRVPLRRLD